MAEAIEAMRTAFSQLSSGDVRMPARSHIDVPEHNGTALFMPSYAPGTHINAIGSYKPEVQEIPAETVCRAQIVVDHWESALAEAGDLIIPLQQGLIREADIHAELGEILNGEAVGRTSDDAVTLFKSVGVAVQDLAAASRALMRAEAERLGTVVPF
jgi:ornithine cyclodeaminase/alanine dehydrogenase-like protein (mu-crystallin family)